MEEVILVDIEDSVIGQMEKMKAHQEGLLHRAFSIMIFNDQGDILLQQRALNKYHSGGLWTNACCSHPRPNESVLNAANRRLMEEMGFETELVFGFKFVYKALLDRGLTEHELDHVYMGNYNGTLNINSQEVADWKWISYLDLKRDVIENPKNYTIWFKDILKNSQLDHVLNRKAN
jgi:isopentenyl-diphosphate delta-isomerase